MPLTSWIGGDKDGFCSWPKDAHAYLHCLKILTQSSFALLRCVYLSCRYQLQHTCPGCTAKWLSPWPLLHEFLTLPCSSDFCRANAQVQREILVPNHRDLTQTELSLSCAYITMEDGERAAQHGLRVVKQMKKQYPLAAPAISYMQLSLRDSMERCRDRGLREQMLDNIKEAEEKLTLQYGEAWRDPARAAG